MARRAGTVSDVKVETKRKPKTVRKPAAKPKNMNGSTAKPLKRESLLVDVTTAIVDRIRTHSSDWAKLGPTGQADIRRLARDTANHLIKECIELTAGDGQPTVKAQLGEVKKHKHGHIEGKFSMSGRDENRLMVIDSAGGAEIHIVLTASEELLEQDELQERLI